jgi:hypothetical protein
MELTAKLQLRPGQRVEGVLVPESVASVLTLSSDNDDLEGSALLVFVADRSTLEEHRTQIIESAIGDRLTWVSYPKSGQLGTDLHRDALAELFAGSGIQPVRQVAIDGTWSALRFRPL